MLKYTPMSNTETPNPLQVDNPGAVRIKISMAEHTILTPDLLEVLSEVKVTEEFVAKLVKHKVVSPQKDARSGFRFWNASDIFKVFCAKTMLDADGNTNPRRLYSNETFHDVARRIGISMLGGYKNYTSMPGWEVVCDEAKKKGIDFAQTKFKYVPREV